MNIGIDLGGSHIGVALVEKDKIIAKKEKDIEKTSNNIKEEIVTTICEYIKKMIKENKIEPEEIENIGISAPGVAKEGIIYNIVNLGITKFKIEEMLKEKLKESTKETDGYLKTKIKIKNDAKCAAIAEFKYGCMKDYEDGVFLTLGTGIGGAVFLEGKLLEPKMYPGTEIGHIIIEKDGKQCKCGNKGCFETYCSMKALKEQVKKQYNLEENVSSKEIIEIIKKEKDNEKMKNIINEYVNYLSIGITNLVTIFEPQVIGIGGSMVYLGDIIIERLKEEIIQKNMLFNKRNSINIQIAKLGNDAGMFGAASL